MFQVSVCITKATFTEIQFVLWQILQLTIQRFFLIWANYIFAYSEVLFAKTFVIKLSLICSQSSKNITTRSKI